MKPPSTSTKRVKRVEPKFKKGQVVFVDTMGKGIVMDSYTAYHDAGVWLYHIKQGEYTLGNIPEYYITLPTTSKKKR